MRAPSIATEHHRRQIERLKSTMRAPFISNNTTIIVKSNAASIDDASTDASTSVNAASNDAAFTTTVDDAASINAASLFRHWRCLSTKPFPSTTPPWTRLSSTPPGASRRFFFCKWNIFVWPICLSFSLAKQNRRIFWPWNLAPPNWKRLVFGRWHWENDRSNCSGRIAKILLDSFELKIKRNNQILWVNWMSDRDRRYCRQDWFRFILLSKRSWGWDSFSGSWYCRRECYWH